MPSSKKLLQAAAGSAGGAGLDVNEVFATHLYQGTGDSTQNTITNGIDLSGEGGFVWTKSRTNTYNHTVGDSESGLQYYLYTNTATDHTDPLTGYYNTFNSNGYTIGNSSFTANELNASGQNYVSWTWRKAPKFFDIQTWTGNSATDRAISHNLGSTPGMIIVKRTSGGDEDWGVWHRSVHSNTSKVVYLNQSGGLVTSTSIFGATNPTDSNFYVGNHPVSNNSGDGYVAYIFAHNDGDGEFGPDADQDIIKCGTYTTDGSGNATVDLGFEPQWLLRKRSDGSQNWGIYDILRGWQLGDDQTLEPNAATGETTNGNQYDITPTGFLAKEHGTYQQYIYVAIRRGSLFPPEDADDVFDLAHTGNGTLTTSLSGHDAVLNFSEANPTGWQIVDRVRGFLKGFTSNTVGNTTSNRFLVTNSTAEESTSSCRIGGLGIAYSGNTAGSWRMTDPGVIASGNDSTTYWWKRAPSYFDVVAYTGTGSARTVSHNLTVAPEMMWVKVRDAVSKNWMVYHKDLDATEPEDKYMTLNTTSALLDGAAFWNDTAPTSTQFTVGSNSAVNASSDAYIAYLFASLDGISKVGSYAGDGNSGRVIDCGFSSGARFVLARSSSHADNWYIFDSERGIVAGNDSRLWLNDSASEITNGDFIDPHSSGFIVNNTNGELNDTGRNYIFYAIA